MRVERFPIRPSRTPTDIIVRITTTGICGSDLHLYKVLAPFLDAGDVLGHEPMGVVEEVGSEVTEPRRRRPRRDPVQHLLRALLHVRARACSPSARRRRCASRARARRCSATPSSTGRCPGGQAEFLRVPQAQHARSRCREGPPDDRFVFLSDVLPTAWQARRVRRRPDGGTLVVLGLGPIGDMAAAIAAAPRAIG